MAFWINWYNDILNMKNFEDYNNITLKWLGRFSLLNEWLSILILANALKSSGMSITEKLKS